ncbi:DUF4142 domain-containing protein [Acetobacter fallax]|uniref:DUF4142 domain-containing protein n=1 Tax=Acetobacter fallax TaxID=1737473 RepID=A0ABX0K5E3_9PROT|nr:DUF4142 domain-containing protein [Acetobacter fallax]NHO31599.1 DUF4142 domain-containing protein [Acetobacter fallax]NHO35158.1 DUF4142 domain-containing protein [Acetobacter fallax]
MNTVSKITILAALTMLGACSAITGPVAPPAPPPPSALSTSDATFVQNASEINLVEVALGKAAATSAENAGVKSYAAAQVSDHTAAENRLSAIASSHGVTLATAPNADDQKIITTMAALKNSAFDQAYLSRMVANHKAALPVMTSEASTSTDIDLKSYAEDNSATVQKHLTAAEALENPGHHAVTHSRRHKRKS